MTRRTASWVWSFADGAMERTGKKGSVQRLNKPTDPPAVRQAPGCLGSLQVEHALQERGIAPSQGLNLGAPPSKLNERDSRKHSGHCYADRH